MGFYNSVEISASGLSAERLAMDVIANNIANANTTHTPGGGAFKRQLVVFGQKSGTDPMDDFGDGSAANGSQGGVQVMGIVQDQTPDRLVFDPSNPDADARGYVHYPNVSVVKEMVDMMAASRAYEANVSAIQESRNMTNAALKILQS
ncbi:MAG TPA: flagellar basal body rod protein FlgC [Candidatus Baltobacteraceae bacterium]|nr:flagellar basal body rod protein FlgC [Candidatus Baltobacteraceae bacterium]